MGRTYIQVVNKALLLCALLLSACVKDKPDGAAVSPPLVTANGNVLVVCEGSLGNGNSTLYAYNYLNNSLQENVFGNANGGAALGDVFQSIRKIDDKLFLCVNNSDKIVVLNAGDYKQVGFINIPKPRYVLPISSTKAYVSTLFSNKVYIINPQSLSIIGSIEMPYQNPESMLLLNGKAYISNWDTACGNIYSIDISTDKIDKTIPINNRAPHAIAADMEGKLWVLSGNVYKGKNSALTVLNTNNEIVKTFYFPAKADVIKPVFNNAKDKLYFIEVDYNGGAVNNGIYSMQINDTEVPDKPFIAAQQYQYYWALGIEPQSDKIYVGDPKGFTQKSTVVVYDANGKQTATFNVGVGVGNFYFD